MLIADAWSCAYLNEHTKDQPEEELEVNCITTQLPVSEKKLKIAEKKTAENPEMQMLERPHHERMAC